MELYNQFIKEKTEASNNFEGIGFAFNQSQFEEMLDKLEAEPKDLYNLGYGTFILKNRYDDLMDMINKYDTRLKEAMKEYDFSYSAFVYELANHEYNITFDYDDVLNVLNLTEDEIKNNPILNKAFEEAKKTVIMTSDF